ncbi:hypothetical protein FSP39_016272 [Pinctada imbricata]|uniref:Endonuclease n=1 Tax=Pinctada imbricata TaxID=66713 RepID=A0AA88YKQ3_PINIB|nr:hypothetical protein FSP39_016272 [Pinctada imbricata]
MSALRISNINIRTADGNSLEVFGTLDLTFKLGTHTFTQNVVIAKLDNLSGIFGIDFLEANDMKIFINDRCLVSPTNTIPLFKDGEGKCCARIRMNSPVEVPAQSEMIIEGYVQGQMGKTFGLVESTQDLQSKGLLIAKSLVKTDGDRVAISVLNLRKYPQTLDSDQVLGKVQSVDEIITPENEQKNDNDNECSLPDHLSKLLEGASDKLSTEERNQLKSLLFKYQHIFAAPNCRVGQTSLVEHRIDTGDSPPVKVPQRRLPATQRKIVEQELSKMIENEIVEPSKSPWASPICLVRKKDQTYRFCIDFRRLNAITKKDAYPLPRVDDFLESLSGCSYFSTLDLAQGYWQCKMADSDKHKTAFSTHKGLYQFNVMPFGLCNAPATFQRLMENVLGNLTWEKCLCYLDDIIIYGKTFSEAIQNLELVFECFRKANLKLKPSKCHLFLTEVSFLGHVVSAKGVQCDPSKIEAVKSWPTPQNVKEVKSFLGLAGYYRRFIPNFSAISFPLNRLMRKKQPFVWDDSCDSAFVKLKQLLTSSPILAFPTENDPFILDTDASLTGIGAVLSQIQNGEEVVIAYASKSLNKSQRRYCTTNRELLAVVTFVRHFRHFLLGRHFTIRSDHASLVWLRNFKEPEGIVARWISILDTFDYELQYRKGENHVNADSLSRVSHRKCKRLDCPDCNSPDSDKNDVTEAVAYVTLRSDQSKKTLSNWVQSWSQDEIRQMQSDDLVIGPFIKLKEKYEMKPDRSVVKLMSQNIRLMYSMWETFEILEGILYRKFVTEKGDTHLQLVAPMTIRNEILTQLHDNKTAGHLGRDKTISTIRQRFYWPGLSKDVKLWCKHCNICAKNKPGPGRGKAPMGHVYSNRPLDRIAIDILGPLPVTDDGNEYIMVLGDYFSKWKEAYPIKNHTAQTVADKLISEFICRFGVPSNIHTDQGREFESNLFKILCERLQINKTRTTPYHPQSDGLVERFNRTLLQMLTSFVSEARDDWDNHLPFIMMAYRATPHDSTMCTPNELMLGREVHLPVDILTSPPPGTFDNCCLPQYVEWVQNALQNSFDFVLEKTNSVVRRQKAYYDRGLKPRKFQKHDWVWRYYPPKADRKMSPSWIGPYLILDKLSDYTYKIQMNQTSKVIVAHVDDLKSCENTRGFVNWDTCTDETRTGMQNTGVRDTDTDIPTQTTQNIEQHENTKEPPKRSKYGRILKPNPKYSD